MFRIALLLGLFSIIGIGLVTITEHFTQRKIKSNEQAALRQSIEAILPANSYNNSILTDTLQVTDPLLGTKDPVTIYRARQDNRPIAVVLTSIAPDGYNGAIQLLIGIGYDGKLTGVRVMSHHETPGLGDKIEIGKSNWILAFNDRSLHNPMLSNWKVKKDGGTFDQFTGATITPRAIVSAIYNCLQYFKNHREFLFSQNEENLNAIPYELRSN
ncbi:RnfABCDGE type electron transport complex subunit G [Candidatus Nitrosoglobus terrae]|uniref:Ion-translocating oxidoreductase complex subunit G n=1 Tax=Candidatus Nitrosoglobus terrae TaxID=1630141 RepID=A0A1Q2SMN6_9GAMM|nr:electron transport complex subunit RsxG [Candidatus Nitrosoglobus terrae]BAW80359.1 RnfABCDGE type electron transport complex subunit G [Candidatus Nitrosoglobus terrae]